MSKFSLFLLLSIILFAQAQFLPGTSPKLGTPVELPTLNTKNLEGKWYVVYNFNTKFNSSVPSNVDCWTAEITSAGHNAGYNITWSVDNNQSTIYTNSFTTNTVGSVWANTDGLWQFAWVGADLVNYTWAVGALYQYETAFVLSKYPNITGASAYGVSAVLYGEGYNVNGNNVYTFENLGCPADL